MKRIEEEEAKSKEERMTTRSSCSSNGLLPSSASPRKTDDLEVGQPIKEFELDDDDDDDDDPFDIAHTKNAPLEILRRWRVNIFFFIIVILSLLL
jgi:Ca2+-transporting ATPase